MSIDFNADRWARVKGNAAQWWGGELERPLIHCCRGGREPGREPAKHPHHGFAAFYDLSIPAEGVVDTWDYHLSRQHFLGDAFPHAWLNFGPGVVAAFLGAGLETSVEQGTVWFTPDRERDIRDLHFEYRSDSVWLDRIKSLCHAAVERWQGAVQVGMTDLGGALDILSTFRPGEGLLFDLIDHPGEVERCTWELHDLWFRYFDEIDAILRPVNPGYTAWAGFYSAEPHYMLQCDFAYMISPEMFDQFVKPELTATCRRLTHAFYHLDGVGQLPHLDSLLAIPELEGVQWVPGDGKPDHNHWPEVFRKIRDAGKLVQSFGGPEVVPTLDEQLGSASGIVHMGWAAPEKRREWDAVLERYGMQEP